MPQFGQLLLALPRELIFRLLQRRFLRLFRGFEFRKLRLSLCQQFFADS